MSWARGFAARGVLVPSEKGSAGQLGCPRRASFCGSAAATAAIQGLIDLPVTGAKHAPHAPSRCVHKGTTWPFALTRQQAKSFCLGADLPKNADDDGLSFGLPGAHVRLICRLADLHLAAWTGCARHARACKHLTRSRQRRPLRAPKPLRFSATLKCCEVPHSRCAPRRCRELIHLHQKRSLPHRVECDHRVALACRQKSVVSFLPLHIPGIPTA